MRAGAPWLRAILALACFGCLGVRAEAEPGDAFSLVTGQILEARPVGPPPCPEDFLCLDWIYRFRISADTRTGRKAPSLFTVEVVVHGPPPKGAHLLLLVRPGERRGPWLGRALGAGRPGEEACVDAASLAEVGLRSPRDARKREDRICFVV